MNIGRTQVAVDQYQSTRSKETQLNAPAESTHRAFNDEGRVRRAPTRKVRGGYELERREETHSHSKKSSKVHPSSER